MSSVSSFCMFDKILYVMLVTDNINNMTKPVKRKNENEFFKKNLTNLKRNQWNVTKREQCMLRCLKLKYAI